MKRWAIRITVFLLLGAIVNVAVAWACAVWVNPSGHGVVMARQSAQPMPHDPDYGTLQVLRTSRAGAMDIKVERWRGGPARPIDESPMSLIPEWAGLREPSDAYKSGAQGRWASGGVGAEIAIIEARGWPMRSMWVSHGMTVPSSGIWTRNGWSTPWMRESTVMNGAAYPLALPLRPIWPEFVVNSIAFACAVAVLARIADALRRRMRIKRGLCPKCAYDLRGSDSPTCPECGAAR